MFAENTCNKSVTDLWQRKVDLWHLIENFRHLWQACVTVGRLLPSLFHRVTGKNCTTSQQRQRPTQYAHTGDLTMAAAGKTYGLARAAPGIIA